MVKFIKKVNIKGYIGLKEIILNKYSIVHKINQ